MVFVYSNPWGGRPLKNIFHKYFRKKMQGSMSYKYLITKVIPFKILLMTFFLIPFIHKCFSSDKYRFWCIYILSLQFYLYTEEWNSVVEVTQIDTTFKYFQTSCFQWQILLRTAIQISITALLINCNKMWLHIIINIFTQCSCKYVNITHISINTSSGCACIWNIIFSSVPKHPRKT